MKKVKFVILSFLVVIMFGSILGNEDFGVVESESTAKIANSFFNSLKKRLNKGVSEHDLVLIVDSLLEEEEIDPSVISLLNNKISNSFGRPWPDDTCTHPASDVYHSWNTLIAHPYGNNITKGDSQLILCLTDRVMDCGYEHSFKGVVTSRFGWRDGRQHNGIDIDLVRGDTVKNVFRGVVRLAKWTGGYGRTVIVRHHNGLETIYAHLYKIMVKPGDYVDPGQSIARGGNSGASRGSHLHFETRFKGVPINPESLIDFSTYSLHSDSVVIRKTRQGYVAFQPGTLFHKIKGGDYLYRIASEYGISVKQLCLWNGISRNSILVAGKELKVSE